MNTTLFFYLVHPLVALFASVGYAIVCNAPRKEIPYCGLTAFLCWLVYQLVLRHDGSSFLATLLATFAATGFARFLLTVFLHNSFNRQLNHTAFCVTEYIDCFSKIS